MNKPTEQGSVEVKEQCALWERFRGWLTFMSSSAAGGPYRAIRGWWRGVSGAEDEGGDERQERIAELRNERR